MARASVCFAASLVTACASAPPVAGTTPHAVPAGRARAHVATRAATAPTLTAPPTPPDVFVHVDATRDGTRRLPADEAAQLTALVAATVARTGFATEWPGGLPTATELDASGARAFLIAATVTSVDVARDGAPRVACEVGIRIAPWRGVDGEERWAAGNAARASGAAQASAASRDPRELERAMRSCARGVVEELTAREVVPFLRQRVAAL